ncbi:MAG: UPF0158 family protein [Bacillota bacterium]|nr:UPF0158 family protein [Bacillota bacterium]
MSDYQEQYNLNTERNDEFLELFRKDLEDHGMKEKSIEGHIFNVDFYINDYVPYYEVRTMEEGCSIDISDFFGDFFIRKCSWASVSSMKNTAASIKKFYKCMVDNEFVTKEQYKELKKEIKENLDTWQNRLVAYQNGQEDWDCDEVLEEIVPVMIEDVVDAFLTSVPNWEQYYDTQTGKIVMLPMYYEDFSYSQEQERLIKEIDAQEERYIVLPNLDTLDSYSIMSDYADSQENKTYKKALIQALEGPRAIYDFMKLVQESSDLENYNFFKVETIVCTMIEWAIEYEIPFDLRHEDIQKLIEEMTN